jgi:5-bromo-4-chloroindolyl phosphate hydrolysis protein
MDLFICVHACELTRFFVLFCAVLLYRSQFMWGFFVEMAGVGPKACPVNKLTAEILAEKLSALASPALKEAAVELSEDMSLEDGIDGGLEHFMEWLPRDNMLCDVGVVLGEARPARYELIGTGLWYNGIKVGTEMAALLEMKSIFDWQSPFSWIPTMNKLNHRYWYSAGIRRHPVTVFNLSGHIGRVDHGCYAGLWGLIVGALSSLMEFFYTADRFARSAGAFGCLFGLVISIYFVLMGAVKAVVVFFDRIALGISNGVLGTDYDYIFDPTWKARVYNTPLAEAEKDRYIKEGITRARKNELNKAMDLVVAAREVFECAHPTYPKNHRHFLVVSLSELTEQVKAETKMHLSLNKRECAAVVDRLESYARLAPPPKRRSTRFPALKSLKATIEKKMSSMGSSLQNVLEEDSTVLEEAPEAALDQSHGAASKDLKKHDESEHSEISCVVKTLANKIHLPSFWHKKPEETEISFSMFLQVLHTVRGDKILDCSRRSRRPSGLGKMAGTLNLDDFSEYLSSR